MFISVTPVSPGLPVGAPVMERKLRPGKQAVPATATPEPISQISHLFSWQAANRPGEW